MYMLTIKNRKCEFAAIKTLMGAGYIKEEFMPLVEIVQENFKYDFLKDQETGQYVKKNVPFKSGANKGKDRWCKVKDLSTERDVTLQKIEELFKRGHIFVDYYRCNTNAYKGVDYQKCPLVLKLSNNLDTYLDKVRSVAKHPNFIPVITIKDGTDKLEPKQLIAFFNELKHLSQGRPLAIRIDNIDGYEDAIKNILKREDYLIFDINETPAASKIEEFDDLNDLHVDGQKILLCSPRKRDITNGKYGEGCVIDNSHIVNYASYGFDGVGDYAGLRDNLPTKGGPTGCALALLYDGWTNEFHAYVNSDSKLGSKGYPEVVAKIYNDKGKLERRPGECIVLKTVFENAAKGSFGVFQTWISYTIERYVQQLYLAHGGYNI